MPEEEWRVVPGASRYEVSSLGRVRSWTGKSPRVLRQHITRQGYRSVQYSDDKRITHTVNVHRLVLLAFVGPPPRSKPLACHNNGDKLDNRLSNMRWDNARSNQADAIAHGTSVAGSRNVSAKITEAQALAIRAAPHTGRGHVNRLAREHGVSRYLISKLLNRKTWRHI